jgi:glutathione S-transferase
MITLIHYYPALGLPDPSPFVLKAMTLLRMAGLDYQSERGMPNKGPKGKLPAIRDDGRLIGDSEIIRWHIEAKYGVDFDRGLDAPARGIAHAFARMLEERTYWVIVHDRWIDERFWPQTKADLAAHMPPLLRLLIPGIARREVRKNLHRHGLGRHSAAEIARMGRADIDAVAAWLGDKPYFMGETPTSADATVYAFLANIILPPFATAMKDEAGKHGNLRAYVERMRARYFRADGNTAPQP